MIGRSALKLATPSAATRVMGFLQMFADARIPIWAYWQSSQTFCWSVFNRTGQRWFYAISLVVRLFVPDGLLPAVEADQSNSNRSGKIRTTPRQRSSVPGRVGPRTFQNAFRQRPGHRKRAGITYIER